MLKSKVCKGCNQELPIENFTKSKSNKDGYENKCKTCRREQRKKYIKICELCGAEFKTYKNTKFCSLKCASDFKHKDKRVEVNCSYCGKSMTRTKLLTVFDNVYCDKICQGLHRRELFAGEKSPCYNRVECTCYYCGKKFKRKPSEINSEHVFCSFECSTENNRNRPRKAIVNIHCETCGKEVTIWRSRLKQAKNHYCSNECSNIGYSKLYRKENHPCYNPELTDFEREKARHTPEYNDWRKAVYARDGYVCQCCGSNRKLRAHHYYNYSEHKDLRHNIDNGVTLCERCHISFHNMHGYKNNTKEQFEEFLKLINSI